MALFDETNNLADGADSQAVRDLPPPEDIPGLNGDIQDVGGEFEPSDEERNAIGRTMFDTPSSCDNTVTILLPQERIGDVPLQSLVRIKSKGDEKMYLGAIVEGPFAEPDGLRADAPVVVISSVHGGIFMPRFHGRAQVELLGEEQGSTMLPPQFRPRPNSLVFPVNPQETAEFLRAGGDLRLGLAVGHGSLEVGIPSGDKNGIPRHLGILGTTGGGKSNTVAVLLRRLQEAGFATILLDTEGEYTRANEPTSQPSKMELLEKRGLKPGGIDNTVVYHLVGRETTNPGHPRVRAFSPRFCELSPHAVSEILELSDAQQERFMQAYDAAKLVMADMKIFPRPDNSADQRIRLEFDELETGYPQITLGYVMDMVGAVLAKLEDSLDGWKPWQFAASATDSVKRHTSSNIKTGDVRSWRALMGKLAQLNRLRIFDSDKAKPLAYHDLITPGQVNPGRVTIIDLSDTDSPHMNNLVIAGVLRGIQKAQDEAYEVAKSKGQNPTPVAVIIEEAHEFLSDQRIKQIPVLFQQVARMVRRGRKRWLGLVFVTQLPQHLPDEVLGLINSYVFHKLSDSNVITRLRRSVGNVDESLWRRLPGLAPGQAVVSLSTMPRPLLVSIDPAACKLGFEE